MNQKLFIIKDFCNCSFILLAAAEGVDIKERFDEAVAAAVKDGLNFRLSDLPEEYLNKFQLSVVPVEPVEMDDCSFGKSTMEEKGILFARCRHCNSFEDGSCFRHGGVCNPDGSDTCIDGEDIYALRYDGIDITYLLLESFPVKPVLDIIEIIAANDDEISSKIKEIKNSDGYNSLRWDLIPTF